MISAPYSLHDIPEATDTLIIVTVFGTIALLTTIFRLLGRRLRSIDVGWDDWFVVMGLVSPRCCHFDSLCMLT